MTEDQIPDRHVHPQHQEKMMDRTKAGNEETLIHHYLFGKPDMH